MLVPDKVIIVSGVGPGLGTKVAVHAAIEGARAVVVSARRSDGVDEAQRAVAETGAKCEVLKQVNDIRDAEACARLVAAATERFGRIDALVNNAVAHGQRDFVTTADLDTWHGTYDTNVIGTLKMSRAAVDQMKTQGSGSIVVVNTMGSKMISDIPHMAYCTSKAALAYATKALATEVGRYNIRVNSIHPGWMWGPTSLAYVRDHPDRFGTEEEGIVKVNSQMPLGRAASDDEVARATLFLASDYASAITGASLDANAGEHMP